MEKLKIIIWRWLPRHLFFSGKWLRDARDAGCEYAIIETSSHALFYHRVHGLRYDAAVLTNIAQDHLDLHGTMDNYVDTKLQLFRNLYKNGIKKWVRKIGVVNIDSEYADRFLTRDIVVDHICGLPSSAQIRDPKI